MKVVALTGGIGSGKSEATKHFALMGVPIVDLDEISHQLTDVDNLISKAIGAEFGQNYLLSNGALNRPRMRELVFNDKNALARLNALLHPAIYHKAIEQIALLNHFPYVILAIPLIDKNSPYLAHIDHVIVVDCEIETQIKRVMERSHLSREQVAKIIGAQISRESRLALADTVVNNDRNLEILKETILKFHENYIKTCIVIK
jgi:dephospho-CoA kinase